jgi:UDP-N-acetylmuramoyl-L-alanyl-D-glutamate--2,6-diaminopimelate ligase
MKLSQLITCKNILADLDIKGITDDSRKVKKGFAFIDTQNNPIYLQDAINNGAIAVITSNNCDFENTVIVDNTQKAYAEISANWFKNPAKDLILIGVTGTNGKTTVSYMVKSILESRGEKVGVIGTVGYYIDGETTPAINTTPNPYYLNELFQKMRKKGCKYVVMEVSSHALSREYLYGLNFRVAMFTNLTQDHLDYHGDMESYYLAKRKLFDLCEFAVINNDDKYSNRLLQEIKCKKSTYSIDNNSDYVAKAVEYFPSNITYQLLTDTISRIKVNTGGKFTVYNSLCAIGCSLELGIPIQNISSALAQINGVKGRAEVVPNTKDFTVIIDYAHTPDGLKNILKTFKECKKNRLIVLFGCGGDRDRTKRPLMGEIASFYADYIIVTSDNPRTENPSQIIKDILKGIPNSRFSCKIIENREEAIKFALSIAQKDDIIVLAGKGHENYQIIGKEKLPFDEREIINKALK